MATALKDDATVCSLCQEVFRDPRVLPCLHTYCLNCIQGWSNDRRPRGAKPRCPRCRKKYRIPQTGLEELPRNFCVLNTLRERDLTTDATESALCIQCTYRAPEKTVKTNTYCAQCQKTFCKACASGHRKQKVSRERKRIRLGQKVKPIDLCAQYPPANCNKHVDEAQKIYRNESPLGSCAATAEYQRWKLVSWSWVMGQVGHHFGWVTWVMGQWQ